MLAHSADVIVMVTMSPALTVTAAASRAALSSGFALPPLAAAAGSSAVPRPARPARADSRRARNTVESDTLIAPATRMRGPEMPLGPPGRPASSLHPAMPSMVAAAAMVTSACFRSTFPSSSV